MLPLLYNHTMQPFVYFARGGLAIIIVSGMRFHADVFCGNLASVVTAPACGGCKWCVDTHLCDVRAFPQTCVWHFPFVELHAAAVAKSKSDIPCKRCKNGPRQRSAPSSEPVRVSSHNFDQDAEGDADRGVTF